VGARIVDPGLFAFIASWSLALFRVSSFIQGHMNQPAQVRSESRGAWFLVASCCLAILFTIPLARMIQRALDGILGSQAYFVATIVIGSFFMLLILFYLRQRIKSNIGARLAWMVFLGGVSVWIIRYQLQSPAEAVHFVEYSLLGFLLFRAWSHHVHDSLVYVVSALCVAIMALVDEFIQWMVPGRFWDYRDIRLNLAAGLVMQLFIYRVIRPSSVYAAIQPASIRLACRLAWLAMGLMGLSLSNTPARVDLYATRIPFLRFLTSTDSVMNEYGFRHADPEIGIFFSRLTIPELIEHDRSRGASAGEIIRRYQSFADYREFIQTFTTAVDPFLHEMRVHLHRRDHYYGTAWQYPDKDPVRFRHHMTVAYRENQILEKYFSNTLRVAESQWGEDQRAYSANFGDLEKPYTSEVSDHLVTAATEFELWIMLTIGGLLTAWNYVRYGRRRPG